MEQKNLIQVQELDLNLYHLWLTIENLRGLEFPDNVRSQIDELFWLVDDLTFKRNPGSCDIVSEKCILITCFENFEQMEEVE